MKNSIGLLCVILLMLGGCRTATPPTNIGLAKVLQPAVSATPPKYGWRQVHQEIFETDPLEGKSFGIPGGSAKLRVAIDAASAVFAGVIPESEFTAIQISRRHFVPADFRNMKCSLQSVDKSDATCDVDRHRRMILIVRDARGLGTVVAGTAGFLRKSPKLMEHAALPDRIQVSVSTWQCLENCPKNGSFSTD